MKYEYEESKRSKVERFSSENPEFYLNLRWFRMYEHMLYEDFGDTLIKDREKKLQTCGFSLNSFEFP